MDIAEHDRLDDAIKEGISIVLFYADWCPYCTAFKPVFESYKSTYKMIKVRINEDDNPLWDRFNITTIPTIIAFKDGRIVARRDARSGIGLGKEDLKSLINELN